MTIFERAEVGLVPGWIALGTMQGKAEPFDRFVSNPYSNPEPCRDRFQLVVPESPSVRSIAFAIADGISSDLHSDEGAQIAVDVAREKLRELENGRLPDQARFEHIFEHVHVALQQHARYVGYGHHITCRCARRAYCIVCLRVGR